MSESPARAAPRLPVRIRAGQSLLARPELILLGVIGGGFIIAPEPVWAMLFYLTVLPGTWLAMARTGGGFRRWPLPPAVSVAVALILWSTLAVLWDPNARAHPGVLALWVWNGACTLTFVLACAMALTTLPCWREWLVGTLLACGAANALIAFLRLPWVMAEMGGRMPGWAETRHQILGASIIGMVVVLAAGRLLARQQGLWSRSADAAVVALGLLFIVMTGSRGPLLAVLGALALLLCLAAPRILAGAAVIVVLLAAASLIDNSLWQEAWRYWGKRGTSERLDIWRQSLEAIREAPWIGHGPSAQLVRVQDSFPHDLFLSTMFYGGAVALGLLVALLALSARVAWRRASPADRATRLALLANVVLSGLTDLSQIIKGPSPMWYIVWLPLLLCLDECRDPPAAAEDFAAKPPASARGVSPWRQPPPSRPAPSLPPSPR